MTRDPLTMIRHLIIAVVAVFAMAGTARADDWRATVECQHGSKTVAHGRPVVLDGLLQCSIEVDAFDDAADVEALMWVTQDGNKARPVERAGVLRLEGSHGIKTFFRFEQQPERGVDFKGCAPFTVHATISRAGNPVWTGEETVRAKCKPKKLKAAFACTMDGCTLSVSARQVKPGEHLRALIRATDRDWQMPIELVPVDKVLAFEQRVSVIGLPPCSPPPVEAMIFDQDDQPRWTGKAKIKVVCAKGAP